MRQDVRTAVLERKLSGLKRLSDPEDQSRDSETGYGQVRRKKSRQIDKDLHYELELHEHDFRPPGVE